MPNNTGYVCDKCGTSAPNKPALTIHRWPVDGGGSKELTLCAGCFIRLLDWIEEKV